HEQWIIVRKGQDKREARAPTLPPAQRKAGSEACTRHGPVDCAATQLRDLYRRDNLRTPRA
ncbi:unnamed protein product, partial [Ectocarpus sp. 12 AP-2014]